MPVSEFFSSIWFYVLASCFAGIGLPLTTRLFSNKSIAALAAKPLGIVVFGYVVWLLASLHILDYQAAWLIGIVFIVCVVTGALLTHHGQKKSDDAKHSVFKHLLVWEGIGLGIYLVYLYIRSHNPDIDGTERFMDMAMLSAAGQTHHFPFIDPWYAGKTVNYYYYGSYLMSLLSNVAHLPYALTYNFAIGFLYSQAALLSSGIIYLLSKSKAFAIAGALLLTTGGTLFFSHCSIQAALTTPATTCSYASSTRLFDPSYIINEIPSYSFTVGDLHAHLLALPFFLLALLLLYALWQTRKPSWPLGILIALCLATSGLINAWDLITLSCLTALTVLAIIWRGKRESDNKMAWRLVKPWCAYGGALILITLALLWPGLRAFNNPVLGLGFAPAYVAAHHLKDVQWPTPFSAQIGMWGILLVGSAYALAQRKTLERGYLVLLGVLSLGIIIGVEFFFIRDIYSIANPPYFRANTTFKFGYHAWSMLCILFAAGLGSLWAQNTETKKQVRAISLSLISIAVVGGLAYPRAAIKQFYPTRVGRPLTLDGSAWMQATLPDDYNTVQYLRANLDDRAIIAEAVGDSYTHFARIATFSGNITPMGWQTHEWTWRFQGKAALKAPVGSTIETGWGAVSAVANDIKLLYETFDTDEAQSIIQKYNIQYIYIGDLERETYPTLNETKLPLLATPIFHSGTSTLYKIK